MGNSHVNKLWGKTQGGGQSAHQAMSAAGTNTGKVSAGNHNSGRPSIPARNNAGPSTPGFVKAKGNNALRGVGK